MCVCVCVYRQKKEFTESQFSFLRYISGSMHYSRVPSAFWKDRLQKFVAGGLNAVQTYVPWNFHETASGSYDFDGDKDIVTFIKTAQEVGLLVILRAGPYICAEWDMGGFPSWLLNEDKIVLRSSDQTYLKYVDRWMGVFLPMMKPLLYENGGPIITVQVENEYGSYYTCDKPYLKHLHDLFRSHLGNKVVLFTTDGDSEGYLKCGTDTSLFYATVDFGITSDPSKNFAAQRQYEPHGPLVNSEFYTGWLDHWGQSHQRRDSSQVASSLDAMLKLNASVNMYMYIGGTNFGFWNGANEYLPVPTSYDYDAPLTEAGDPWDKFTKIRDVIKNYRNVSGTVPSPAAKSAYGQVMATKFASLFDNHQLVMNEMTSDNPINMEKLGQSFGFINYTKVVSSDSSKMSDLTIHGCNDRASVYINSKLQGLVLRVHYDSDQSLNVSLPKGDSALTILVENMGRINYGSHINDKKGIVGGVTLDGKPLTGLWKSQPLPLNNTDMIIYKPITIDIAHTLPDSAVFYSFTFKISGTANDTFLDVTNWTKGVAYVNGFNIGRYWPHRGPQKTLYVPSSVLKSNSDNMLVLFEVDAAPCRADVNKCMVMFTDTPNIG